MKWRGHLGLLITKTKILDHNQTLDLLDAVELLAHKDGYEITVKKLDSKA